ncbi:hypothetical protein HMI54_006162 [Coelomomyces lativittatus]|nr:hypothetical protein HMI54_006162 [Coelomomyces lativittatus]
MSKSHLIVIKVGSSSICDEVTYEPKFHLLQKLVACIALLRENGHKVILVSSGAIAMGLYTMKIQQRPKKLQKLQFVDT